MFAVGQKIRFLARRHPLLYRLRYAWIVELDGYDFAAPPPVTLRTPSRAAPMAFRDAIVHLEPLDATRFDEVCRLAYDLSHGHRRGPGLGVTSTRALEAIYRGGAGVCSDHSQVFLGLCLTAGIPCREWGLTAAFDRQGVGHAVTEVFVEELDKWVFLDPYLSVYGSRRGDRTPLAMTELVDLATAGECDQIELHTIDIDAVDPSFREGYVARYLDRDHHYFVLSNNDIFRQDRYLQRLDILPLPVRHLVMLLGGAYQRFHVYSNTHNRRRMERSIHDLRRFGRRFALVSSVLAALGILAAAGAAFLAS